MTTNFKGLFLLLLLLLLSGNSSADPLAKTPELTDFIDQMATKHQFDKEALTTLFQEVKMQPSILRAISAPAEGKPWFEYRKIFITGARIDGGAKFWRKHKSALTSVSQQYGVPAQIIVAIIGVETRYGNNTGSYRVIDALSTLAFGYPKRSDFFRSELEEYLLLCREEGVKPTDPTGSYAGAMGMPQFMPSSFRNFAADFDSDGRRDIWDNPGDVFASIANYFKQHGWQSGEAVAYPVTVKGTGYQKALTKSLKPEHTLAQLEALGVESNPIFGLPPTTPVKLLKLDSERGSEFWLALNNFYAITRYNHSKLYGMAVYQLSHLIKKQYDKQLQ